jgi:hypothetical protein
VIVTPRLQLQILEVAIEPLADAIGRVAPGEIIHVPIFR